MTSSGRNRFNEKVYVEALINVVRVRRGHVIYDSELVGRAVGTDLPLPLRRVRRSYEMLARSRVQ